jgi:hypothetical protein
VAITKRKLTANLTATTMNTSGQYAALAEMKIRKSYSLLLVELWRTVRSRSKNRGVTTNTGPICFGPGEAPRHARLA